MRQESDSPPLDADGRRRDPYRAVIVVLIVLAFLGAVGAIVSGFTYANPILLDAAVALGLSTGVLFEVALAQREPAARPNADEAVVIPPVPEEATGRPGRESPPPDTPRPANSRSRRIAPWIKYQHWLPQLRDPGVSTGAAGAMAIIWLVMFPLSPLTSAQDPLMIGIVAACWLCAAGLAAAAVHYLANIEPAALAEGPGLCRGARVLTWILLVATASIGLSWVGQTTILWILQMAVLTVNVFVCYGLVMSKRPASEAPRILPLDFGVLSMLGSRTNILASVLDAGQRQLGIDLRSTWALTIVRRGLEPLVIGLCLAGWLSTSLTVVGVEEQGLVERLGVPRAGQPLLPGLHLHWPWPVDQVFRIPVARIQVLTVGHEGEEEGGPENVLWAVEHAPNEYTLLLGDGRDLITIDAGVQFRIRDARAWRYGCQNPADALRALAYRAVMRSTVNRTLSDALSENVARLTEHMRAVAQQDADALGLGVEVLGFTVGGMHPPVPVARDYQAVVSAELRKVTAVVEAQVFRDQTLPAAQASVLVDENTARADGAGARALAAGEAWSFRTLESQYRAAPQEYLFRRRLEALETGLSGRNVTIVDSRFQRDGGELWVTP